MRERLGTRVCQFSDRSTVAGVPPEEACPPGPDADFPFCGASCAGCDVSDTQVVVQPSCIGVNANRGIGLCTTGRVCDAREYYFMVPHHDYEGGPVTCLVQRDPATGEFDDQGSITGEAACRAYRALYPGQVDCRNSDWESI